MKRLLSFGVLLASAVLSNAAMAADLQFKAPPPVPVWGDWTQFYFGLNIGNGSGKTSWCTEVEGSVCPGPDTYKQSSDGITEGGQFGYRYQFSGTPVVVGAEAMLNGMDISRTVAGAVSPATTTRYTSFNNLASVTGSLGLALGRVLAYGKGGWAATELNLDADDTVSGLDVSRWNWVNGWTVGAGLEYQFFTHLSLGIEYNYYQFNVSNLSAASSLGGTVACAFCDFGRTSEQTILARINIKLWPWGP